VTGSLRRDDPVEQVSIRAVRPDDRGRIVKAFKGLERASVYLRFSSYKKELEDEELRRVTECDGASEAALVATVGTGEQEIIVALGEYVRSGSELLHCEERGVWVRKGEMPPDEAL